MITGWAAVNVLDPHSLLSGFGPFGVGVVLIAETGLRIGFFLPGNSSLFPAGVLSAAAGSSLPLPLGWVPIAAALGACPGAQVGYLTGRRPGPAPFDTSNRTRLRQGRDRAEIYLARYGYGRAIVLARFIALIVVVSLIPLAVEALRAGRGRKAR